MEELGSLEGERLDVEMILEGLVSRAETPVYSSAAFTSLSWSVGGVEVEFPGGLFLDETLNIGTLTLGPEFQPTVNGEPGTFMLFIVGFGSDGFPATGGEDWIFRADVGPDRSHYFTVMMDEIVFH